MLSMDPVILILRLPVLLFSLSMHELAHAWAADRLGDCTPRLAGRLTLSPLAHLDPMGALALLITGRYGWAKPVMVNPRNFSNPEGGMVLVSLAGPLSNLGLAMVFATIAKTLNSIISTDSLTSMQVMLSVLLNQGVWVNLGLAVFNLVPIPPLDGSKVLRAVLRGRAYNLYYQLEQHSYIILILFIATPLASQILTPIIVSLYRAIM